MTPPVYFCALDTQDRIRKQMCMLCWERWRLEGPVIHLSPAVLHIPPTEFQVIRRRWAEEHTASPFYILADDDCLPVTPNFLHLGVEVLKAHPDFAILSMHPQTIRQWNPPHYVTRVDADVQEHVSVGGIRFCRTGCMKAWPAQDGPGYDRTQCEALRAGGWRVGYFNNLMMNHLGEGYSTVWPESHGGITKASCNHNPTEAKSPTGVPQPGSIERELVRTGDAVQLTFGNF